MPSVAIAALIDKSVSDGASYAALAERARAAGHNLSKSDISNFRLGVGKTLTPDKINALAYALGTRPWVVAVAWLKDYGIGIPVDVWTPEQAIERDHSLAPETKRALLAILAVERG